MQLCRVISWLFVNGFSSVRPFWKGFLVLYNFYFIQLECQSSRFRKKERKKMDEWMNKSSNEWMIEWMNEYPQFLFFARTWNLRVDKISKWKLALYIGVLTNLTKNGQWVVDLLSWVRLASTPMCELARYDEASLSTQSGLEAKLLSQ